MPCLSDVSTPVQIVLSIDQTALLLSLDMGGFNKQHSDTPVCALDIFGTKECMGTRMSVLGHRS